jgi:hypothetical protein
MRLVVGFFACILKFFRSFDFRLLKIYFLNLNRFYKLVQKETKLFITGPTEIVSKVKSSLQLQLFNLNSRHQNDGICFS